MVMVTVGEGEGEDNVVGCGSVELSLVWWCDGVEMIEFTRHILICNYQLRVATSFD